MAFEQPRVPEFPHGGNVYTTLRNLILFLKGFCMASWKANNNRIREIKELKERISKLEEVSDHG
ncbi:MAG: hypothetical protein E7321_00040 [Clostridiales bacterium]|nr:hypothetical protein [Clostridiales bacterium]